MVDLDCKHIWYDDFDFYTILDSLCCFAGMEIDDLILMILPSDFFFG